MEMIERLQPNMHCCIYNATIIALHVITSDNDASLKNGLLDFCGSIDYYMLYGLEYNDLLEPPRHTNHGNHENGRVSP